MHFLIALLLMLQTAAPAPTTDDIVARAAVTAARLHDDMLDPASFVLDGVYVTKPSKRRHVSLCFEFRSHNRSGGYSDARAVVDGDDKDRLSVYSVDDGAGHFQGYDVGWIAPCKAKNIDRDITAEVVPLAKGLYRKER